MLFLDSAVDKLFFAAACVFGNKQSGILELYPMLGWKSFEGKGGEG